MKMIKSSPVKSRMVALLQTCIRTNLSVVKDSKKPNEHRDSGLESL